MTGRILEWKDAFSAGELHARASSHRGRWDVRRPSMLTPSTTHARLVSSLLGTRLPALALGPFGRDSIFPLAGVQCSCTVRGRFTKVCSLESVLW